ncbi:transcription termination factor NusA [Christensenellaceae bacterium OttesenSCG-928-M15]|nr:transcription termination factor NusA [Christensenellaceae bacterium OttesenSCG-928-M15]
MNAEFMDALNALEKERGINKDILIDAVENALISAYRRNYGTSNNVRAEVDRDTGEIQLYASKSVVEQVENIHSEISVDKAKKINMLYEVGDVLEEEVKPKNFGRIAAQTAKQVVVQRIREAERGVIYDEYVEKENEVLTAIVQRVEKSGAYVELGKTDGLLTPNEMIPGESFESNDRIKVYVLEVRKTNKGPQVLVSRTHPGLVKRLFELEVPEIQTGVVQVRSIAREAGFRTKVAVSTNDPQVDPVGACVGQRGIRVERIVNELHNEKIDIIEWDPDSAVYIAKALSPAKVLMVYINEEEKAAKVIVPDNQLSLAIGKEGQNARLAAKLTGWKIDIKNQSQAEEAMVNSFGEEEESFEEFEEFEEEYQEEGAAGEFAEETQPNNE